MFQSGATIRVAAIFMILALSVQVTGCQPQGEPEEPEEEPGLAAPWDALPFGPDQAGQTWEVGEGNLLVERVENQDRSFYLYHADSGKTDSIIWPVENATYFREEAGYLVFIGRGGSDTGNFEFPYLLRYSMPGGDLTREDLFLGVEEPVAFGKPGWKQVLTALEYTPGRLSFHFVPHQDEVLAADIQYP